MTWLYVLLISLVSAVFYRLGGTGGAWWKNTKVRDFGCPLCFIGVCLVLGITAEWYEWFLTFMLLFGALTTYWEHWGGEGVEWYEWALTGLMYGVAALPLVWGTDMLSGYFLRCIILSLLTVAWSEAIWRDWLEEGGRGFFLCATTPLMLIT
jgi:hypothetical protein